MSFHKPLVQIFLLPSLELSAGKGINKILLTLPQTAQQPANLQETKNMM
jgi:hypothetical protein